MPLPFFLFPFPFPLSGINCGDGSIINGSLNGGDSVDGAGGVGDSMLSLVSLWLSEWVSEW